jgi:patatin-like phospholipase/acyl hydrolase
VKVLCIDGGGIRGLIPALVLAEIERRTGRRTAEMVDLVAGTSTGGVLACGLTRPGPDGRPLFSAEELAGIYVQEGPKIFSRSLAKRVTSGDGWLDERYDDDGLNAALVRYLGGAHLREATTALMVTAYDIAGRFAFFFRSERAKADPTYDFPLWEVARSTAAAPTYFEPWEATDVTGAATYPLIDGGIYANNPSMCAVAELGREKVDLVASLGTGGQIRPYKYGDARGWGQLEWARPLVDMVFDGLADTVDFEVDALLPPGGYVRLQTKLTIARDDMDDASEQNLSDLREEGRKLLRERAGDIDALCEKLSG